MSRKPSVFLLTIVAMVASAAIVCQAQPQNLLLGRSDASSSGPAQPLLTRHVRDVVANGQAKSVGRLPGNQTMKIDVVLQMKDRAGLQSFLQQAYDPTSPYYRNFLTPKEFTESFGPTQDDYNAVLTWAGQNGLTVVGGSRDGMNVQLQGSVAAVENALHVQMNVYQHPTEDRTFFSPDREPTVNLPFQLWHIAALDSYSLPKPLLSRKAQGVKSNATTGSCPSQSFCGSDMRAAYYEGTALTGAGQNIGLFEYYGFDIQDVNTYYTNAKQTRTANVVGISTDGTSINCVYPSCDDTEQTIDITQALGMAPGVSNAYVYVGSASPLDDAGILSCMTSTTAPCPDPVPLQISCSWGWRPADPTTDDPYYEKMAAQGQSFFVAAGDSDKWTSNNYPYPAEDANIIGVGGTDLTTTGPGGDWSTEVGWVDGGGGISPDKIAIPTWQQLPGVITSTNKGSTVYRNGPDVTGNANFTFYVCADQEACTANEYGGTSFAAPMWAGYIALTNEQAATNDDLPPGFINPTIYPLALGSTYATLFHDITSGNNGFPAEVGYDLDSGWGSMNTDGLINALAPVSGPPPSFSLSASPTTISVAPGGKGSSTITATVANGFDAAITLTASGQPKGVQINFSKNPIPAPGSGTSLLRVNTSAAAKAGTSTITITGTGGGLTETTTITLTIT